MNELDCFVNDFIELGISCLREKNPRDEEYAVRNFIDKLNTVINLRGNLETFESLYHEYRIGTDILEILSTNHFYTYTNADGNLVILELTPLVDRPISKEKNSFAGKVGKKNGYDKFLPGILEMHKRLAIQTKTKRKPIDRNKFIADAKLYIAIKRLISWLDQNGLEIPKGASEKALLREKIDKCLKVFNSGENCINSENYMELVKLLTIYFLTDEVVTLENPIETNGRIVRNFCFSLGSLYKDVTKKNVIPSSYFALCTKNLALLKRFGDVPRNKTLESYFTTNPK